MPVQVTCYTDDRVGASAIKATSTAKIQICEDGFVALNQDGTWSGEGIPGGLRTALRPLRHKSPKPDLIAVGGEYWFVQFADGSSDWHADLCPSFGDHIETSDHVKCMALSPDSGYAIRFEDDEVAWQDVPIKLANKLNSRRNQPAMEFVSLGGDGEWFVRWEDGQYQMGGFDRPYEFSERAGAGNHLRKVVFGPHGQWHAFWDDKAPAKDYICPLCNKRRFRTLYGGVSHVESGGCTGCLDVSEARKWVHHAVQGLEARKVLPAYTINHKAVQVDEVHADSYGPGVDNYRCRYCNRALRTFAGLLQHQRDKHGCADSALNNLGKRGGSRILGWIDSL